MLDAGTRRYLDAIAVSWCALWILIGVAVAHEVRGLRSLSESVAVAGNSLDDTARTLDSFGSVPFIGPKAAGVAADARRTARSARASARESRASVDNLAFLLGFSVPAVAIVPLLLAYALLRVRR